MSNELRRIDQFVLDSLLDDVESAESISDSVHNAFSQQEIEESLQLLIMKNLVQRVEFDQTSKVWKRFSDYKKNQWFDLTDQGRSVARKQQVE